MNENSQPTNQDILDAVSDFASRVEERFQGQDQQFDQLKIKTTRIEATMVTKEYLAAQMADLRGDLVVMMRKEDTKLKALVEILKIKQVISDKEVKQIMTMEPFAQLVS